MDGGTHGLYVGEQYLIGAPARSEKYKENCNTISHLRYVLTNNDHKPNIAQNGPAVS